MMKGEDAYGKIGGNQWGKIIVAGQKTLKQ